MALPGVPSVLGQLINGHAFSWSSIELIAGATAFTNLQSIQYSDALDPGILRGTSSKVIARTRGEYTAEGSFSVYKPDFETLKAELAATGQGGFMEAQFDISVNYSETSSVPVTDSLIGCRIVSLENDHSSGNEALVITVTLNIMEIAYNGVSATSGGASFAGIGAAAGGLLKGGL